MSWFWFVSCPTWEVTHARIESIHHAHADQDTLHVITLLHLEPRQAHLNFRGRQHVWMRPLHKVVIGQLLLQLGVNTKSIISLSCVCLYLWKCMCVHVLPSPDQLNCHLYPWGERWACWAPSLCKASPGPEEQCLSKITANIYWIDHEFMKRTTDYSFKFLLVVMLKKVWIIPNFHLIYFALKHDLFLSDLMETHWQK